MCWTSVRALRDVFLPNTSYPETDAADRHMSWWKEANYKVMQKFFLCSLERVPDYFAVLLSVLVTSHAKKL